MTKVLQYTASGEAHGLIDTLTNSVENNDFKHMTPATKAKLEKEKRGSARIVKVEYLNSRGKHERLDHLIADMLAILSKNGISSLEKSMKFHWD